MKAYRVNLIGTNEHYLVTSAQKTFLDQAINEKAGNNTVQIGGDTIRLNAIRSITATDVDLNSCPGYFQSAVERERKNYLPNLPEYRKLPTSWVILAPDGTIMANGISREEENSVVKSLKEDQRFYLAKCHYEMDGGEPKYYTNLEQIAEALEKRPIAGEGYDPPIVQIYHYGKAQLVS